MSASIWAPGSDIINIDAETTNKSQVFTATAGQTAFTLTSFTYTVGTESIAVYRGGQRLIKGVDWSETDSTTFTITGISLDAGETIECVAVLGASGANAVASAASAAAALVSETNAAVSEANAAASAASAAHPWSVESGGIYYDGGAVRLGAAGARILGDFSNATFANRVMFQTSTANSLTSVSAIPNGSGTASEILAWNGTDTANGSYLLIGNQSSYGIIAAGKTGSGTYLPMTFHTGGSERMRIDTSGRLGIGGTPSSIFDLYTPVGRTFLTYSGSAQAVSAVNLANNAQVDLNFLAGNVTLNTSTGGLGYGTGAGGTTTQPTSKGTAVTLNKPCGQIIMNNASLAAGALVTFAVNNSLVTQYDVPVVALGNVGTGSFYEAWVSYVATGVFYVTLKNNSGSALGEAAKINFAILKGAIA